MNTRLLTLANVTFITMAFSLAPIASTPALAQDKPAVAATTEDVLHMRDGRVLRGQIVSETKTQIVFEYRDAKLNITTKLTLAVDQVAQIERDVAVAAPAPETTPESGSSTPRSAGSSTSSKKKESSGASYGASRVMTDSLSVPLIYLVPMKGQMVTDINHVAYKGLIEDIKAKKPDVIIIELNSTDHEDTFRPFIGEGGGDPEEIGLLDFEELFKLADVFRDDMRDFKQVVWVHDAVGIASNMALMWPDLYMTPNARLAGMASVLAQSGAKNWSDPDVRAKMYAAWTGKAKGLIEYGGYSTVLADAMIDPEYFLSGSWRGREVVWSLDDTGEYLVDGNDKRPAFFYAKVAEDLCLSDGTAATLDDLALLLGIREYRLDDTTAVDSVADYVGDWRRAYEEAKTNIGDHEQNMGWASGDEAVQYMGRAKGNLERIQSLIERYKAVEIRMAREYGLNTVNLQIEIEKLKETLRALREAKKRQGGGGGGGGGRGVGGGGGGVNN